MQISTFVEGIKKSEDLGPQVVYHRYLPAQDPKYDQSQTLSPEILKVLGKFKIEGLYTHQIKAIEKLKEGKEETKRG
jgi:DEAD/DEAH box helicase domain-containing protein